MRGVVLAGGKSSRFGQDKALARYNGATLLERAVDLLDLMNLKPVVVTRRGAEYSLNRGTVIYDKLHDLGPLGGIYTAMTVFKDTPFFVLTCDMPALDASVLIPLLKAYQKNPQLTHYRTSAQVYQPFPGIYVPELLPRLSARIVIGRLGVQDFIRSVSRVNAVAYDGAPGVFMNVNFPEDLCDFFP